MVTDVLAPSRYNHLVKVTRTNGATANIITNLLFGASCFINDALYDAFSRAEKTGVFARRDFDSGVVAHSLKSGFLFEGPQEEPALIEPALIEQLGRTFGGRDEIAAGLNGGQYGFITSLNCNLACPYCFQKDYADSLGFLTRHQVDVAIGVIEASERRVSDMRGAPSLPKISITGGEPLLPSRANTDVLDYLIGRLVDLGWPFSITTNGTHLNRFVKRHEVTPQCRNIQVTLDGPRGVHDLRRAFRGGRPSFDIIAGGVDAALHAGWKITLRVNLDTSNVHRLEQLGAFIHERGWQDFEHFSAYVSPVTDHESAPGIEAPDEAELLSLLLDEVRGRPWIRDVFDVRHFRGFNYVEQMLIHRTPRFPVVFRCEAITGMYIFDPSGSIHVCLEAVGQRHRRIGTYDPEFSIDQAAAQAWSSRNVLAMPDCVNCKVRFVCAGGCAQEAFNARVETVCMPFLKEMEIAWQFFAETQPQLFE